MVQLSFMTTGKSIALTRQTFVGKIMSLLFNMLSRLVITFLPRRLVTAFLSRSKCLNFMAAVTSCSDVEPNEIYIGREEMPKVLLIRMNTVKDFIFSGSKITADGDCSHEIKRCLLLGRKVMKT